MPPTRERAGYTSNIFVIDVSQSMGELMSVEAEEGYGLTKLEWALEYVIRKIQEFIFRERKTEECGIILFGTDETTNQVNNRHDGYENITELVPLSAPTVRIIDALRAIKPEEGHAEALDALIVAIQTQTFHLGNKRTWKRRITLVTDGESECSFEDWEKTVDKLKELEVKLSVIGIDFDDEEEGFKEKKKSKVKRVNEEFWHQVTDGLPRGLGMVGNVTAAIASLSAPQLKQTQSTLASTFLRIGNREVAEEGSGEGFLEIPIKMAKATSLAKPLAMKKLHKRGGRGDWRPVGLQTDYVVHEEPDGESPAKKTQPATNGHAKDVKSENEAEDDVDTEEHEPKDEDEGKVEFAVEKENLVKAFKYGATWVPCEEGEFEKLQTTKGLEVIGFIRESQWRREYALGEVSYIYATDTSAKAQITFSAIVQAMAEKGVMMVVRYVWRDGADPKVGICKAQPIGEVEWGGVDCLLYVQMPFAEDVRQYKFNSLETLYNRNGERVTQHSTLPTQEQQEAMDTFVDAMDLMEAAEDDEGNRIPWFDPALSFNPALHRVKQALFHGGRVLDPDKDDLPPPHSELTKYFDTPEEVVERAKHAADKVKKVFNIKRVPPKLATGRKKGAQTDAPEYMYETVEDILGTARPTRSNDPDALLRTPSKTKPTRDPDVTVGDVDMEDANSAKAGGYLSSPAPSPPREPGRLIGTSNPMRDFDALLENGDMVSKAMEDMGVAIRKIAGNTKRTPEVLKCIKAMRTKGMEEDEVDSYQQFLVELKKEATAPDYGNPNLWPALKKEGPSISWITSDQAEAHGSTSLVSDDAAYKFLMS